MISTILPLLKFWKQGGLILLALIFLTSLYLAHHRGEKLDQLQKDYKNLNEKNQAYTRAFEKVYTDEKNRHEFRLNQTKKIRTAKNDRIEFSSELRSAYDSLRRRQANHAAR